LAEDPVEINKYGHSPAVRSREFAAITETLFCELYAALDGLRRTLFGAYHSVRGVQKDSTEKLFRKAKDKKYGPEFPEDIRAILASAYAAWFPRLRSIRSAVTHGEVGYCHLDAKTQTVSYMHQGLGTAARAMGIKDVVGEVNSHFLAVSKLVESVYRFLCSKLQPVEKNFVCGVYQARIYQRIVAYSTDISFHSGRCATWELFEKEPGTECPLLEFCGAYKRAKTPQ
jgi:hypothetical protein